MKFDSDTEFLIAITCSLLIICRIQETVGKKAAEERIMECPSEGHQFDMIGSASLVLTVDSKRWLTRQHHCFANIQHRNSSKRIRWEIITYNTAENCPIGDSYCRCQPSLYVRDGPLGYHKTVVTDSECLINSALNFTDKQKIQKSGDNGTADSELGILVIVERFDKSKHLYAKIKFVTDGEDALDGLGASMLLILTVAAGVSVLTIVTAIVCCIWTKNRPRLRYGAGVIDRTQDHTQIKQNQVYSQRGTPTGQHPMYKEMHSPTGFYTGYAPDHTSPGQHPVCPERHSLRGHRTGYAPGYTPTGQHSMYPERQSLTGHHTGHAPGYTPAEQHPHWHPQGLPQGYTPAGQHPHWHPQGHPLIEPRDYPRQGSQYRNSLRHHGQNSSMSSSRSQSSMAGKTSASSGTSHGVAASKY